MNFIRILQKTIYTAQLGRVSILFFIVAWFGIQPCTSVLAAGRVNSRPGQDQAHKFDPQKSQTPPRANITFTNLAIVDSVEFNDDKTPLRVKDKDNKDAWITFHGGSYRASDGKTLTAVAANLVTPAFAAAYLEKKLSSAKIIDREPRKNQKGEIIGERIVALLSVPANPEKAGPDDPHKTVAAVMRTNGTIYQVISATGIEDVPASLDDVLALEQYLDNLHPPPQVPPPHGL